MPSSKRRVVDVKASARADDLLGRGDFAPRRTSLPQIALDPATPASKLLRRSPAILALANLALAAH
jgi:hypothetical protein